MDGAEGEGSSRGGADAGFDYITKRKRSELMIPVLMEEVSDDQIAALGFRDPSMVIDLTSDEPTKLAEGVERLVSAIKEKEMLAEAM